VRVLVSGEGQQGLLGGVDDALSAARRGGRGGAWGSVHKTIRLLLQVKTHLGHWGVSE
jgi:hypothetical protein